MATIVGADWTQFIHGGLGEKIPKLTVIAGENGSGKSRVLRHLALLQAAKGLDVLAVASSSFDRFQRLGRRAKVFSPRTHRSPEVAIKAAIAHAHSHDDLALRAVSRVLRLCGYQPEVGINVVPRYDMRSSRLYAEIDEAAAKKGRSQEELVAVINLVSSLNSDDGTYWIDFDSPDLVSSHRANIALVLLWEKELLAMKLIRPTRIYVSGPNGVLPLRQASSGELSLITSVAFLSVASKSADLIVVDEPENSLHPQWQKQYMEILQSAIGYRTPNIAIATHSPLIVLGADQLREECYVVVLSDTIAPGQHVGAEGLEEIMAKVFNTITPKNHYLSRMLVALLDDYEGGILDRDRLLDVLGRITESGVDDRQNKAIRLVREMAFERRER